MAQKFVKSFLWSHGRMTLTRILSTELDEPLPGYSAFCVQLSPETKANEIGYLPLTPSSPTTLGFVKTALSKMVQLARAVGMSHTVITADQDIYGIAYDIRKQHLDEFSNVVLMLGGFHLSHNYIRAITKIMEGSGAEDILVEAEVLLSGIANKAFREKGDYYQTLRALQILYVVMLHLQWKAFEEWCLQDGQDTQCLKNLSNVVQSICEANENVAVSSALCDARDYLEQTQSLLDEFKSAMSNSATHILCYTFLEMMKILVYFLYAQRDGNWLDYLDQAGQMLPYLVAAGHHKYGIYLSLHLQEMKDLQRTAPEINREFIQGQFTVHRSDGRHNGVSPDMALEQTYNAEVKQKQGLSGITLQPKAQMKWLYTKLILTAVAGKFRRMTHADDRGSTSGQRLL